MITPRARIERQTDSPPGMTVEKVEGGSVRTFDGHHVCSARPGEYLWAVKARCATKLGLKPNEIQVICSPSSILVYPYVDLTEFSEENVECSLLSGSKIQIPGKMPIALVYELLAEAMGCQSSQIRLLYDCAEGCQSHSKSESSKCKHVSGDVQLVCCHHEETFLTGNLDLAFEDLFVNEGMQLASQT